MSDSPHEPLRVLHCPMLVGGNAAQLARSERRRGLASHSVAFTGNYLNYACDEVLWQPEDSLLTRESKRWRLLRRALADYDVVHFNCGLSIMPNRINAAPLSQESQLRGLWRSLYRMYAALFWMKDLPLLKRAGKAVFVTYQGDDARQGDFCRAHFDIHFADEVPAGYYTPESDARKREEIACVDRYADGIYGLNPDLFHVLPARARFLPYGNVDLEAWTVSRYVPGSRGRPLVVHAPSHQGVKGTRFIVETVERLRQSGLAFDFRLVEKLSNAEARRVYEGADLVLDQVLAGWYGGLSVEAMALGRPSVCYIRESDLGFIDPAMRRELPFIQATPASLGQVLREWLTTHRHRLAEAGARARTYVENWHDPLKIAARLEADYLAALRQRRSTRCAA